jgi:hypothetical protein
MARRREQSYSRRLCYLDEDGTKRKFVNGVFFAKLAKMLLLPSTVIVFGLVLPLVSPPQAKKRYPLLAVALNVTDVPAE